MKQSRDDFGPLCQRQRIGIFRKNKSSKTLLYEGGSASVGFWFNSSVNQSDHWANKWVYVKTVDDVTYCKYAPNWLSDWWNYTKCAKINFSQKWLISFKKNPENGWCFQTGWKGCQWRVPVRPRLPPTLPKHSLQTVYELLPNWSRAQRESVNSKHQPSHCCLHQRYNHTPAFWKSHQPWQLLGGRPGGLDSISASAGQRADWLTVSNLQHDTLSQTSVGGVSVAARGAQIPGRNWLFLNKHCSSCFQTQTLVSKQTFCSCILSFLSFNSGRVAVTMIVGKMCRLS